MKYKSHIVVGFGEVGKAIAKILQADSYDLGRPKPTKTYDVLHICFPYVSERHDEFIAWVKTYQTMFNPKLTIIHSSTDIGVSRMVGAVHSPIRGVHPYLVKGINTFVKYFGGSGAQRAARIFKEKGIKTVCHKNQEDTEALKLWDTTQLGWMVLAEKIIHNWCQKHGRDFNFIYTHGNKTYNDGYTKLKRPEVVRPHLKHMDGKIGGHCVIPNAKLLNEIMSKMIIHYNDTVL